MPTEYGKGSFQPPSTHALEQRIVELEAHVRATEDLLTLARVERDNYENAYRDAANRKVHSADSLERLVVDALDSSLDAVVTVDTDGDNETIITIENVIVNDDGELIAPTTEYRVRAVATVSVEFTVNSSKDEDEVCDFAHEVVEEKLANLHDYSVDDWDDTEDFSVTSRGRFEVEVNWPSVDVTG